jgi:predicted NBD/HSP70 family sugar kinase
LWGKPDSLALGLQIFFRQFFERAVETLRDAFVGLVDLLDPRQFVVRAGVSAAALFEWNRIRTLRERVVEPVAKDGHVRVEA